MNIQSGIRNDPINNLPTSRARTTFGIEKYAYRESRVHIPVTYVVTTIMQLLDWMQCIVHMA
jgi:hypothetical protein